MSYNSRNMYPTSIKESLKVIKQKVRDNKYQEAFDLLSLLSKPEDDFALQTNYASFFKDIADHLPSLKKIRVAVLASSTATHFNDVLKFWLGKEGFNAQIYESDYSTIHQSILDPQSRLYEFDPDIVFLFTSYRDVKCALPPGTNAKVVEETISAAIDECVSLWKVLRQKSNCHIIQNNADMPYHRVFGNYETTPVWGQIHLLRQFNLNLTNALELGVSILDLDFLASVYGLRRWHDSRFWYHSKHPFALDATGLVANELSRTIGAIKGVAKKCLVLDLDNTLWGGVIADDGLEAIELGSGSVGEAFVDFQRYLLKLKERGIILAVVSKNEEEIAKEPFLKHPDMVLKLEDIVIFKANWRDKASNIKEIADSLNIGLDSIVFVDDNPVEREFVKINLPEVSVPQMPIDPSAYIDTMSSGSYFETIVFSDEDSIRSTYYRSNIERTVFQNQFSDLSDYLRSLDMEMIVNQFDEFHLPRIAQLINKSNQFHLTTTRYTEGEISSIGQDKDRNGLYFKLKDRFGDNGLISAVILQKQPDLSIYIDTWVMSCRVLSRGVEEFICSEIISFAKERQCQKIIGKYIPTSKNKLVADLYERLHFKMIKKEQGITLWELILNDNNHPYSSFIKKIKNGTKLNDH